MKVFVDPPGNFSWQSSFHCMIDGWVVVPLDSPDRRASEDLRWRSVCAGPWSTGRSSVVAGVAGTEDVRWMVAVVGAEWRASWVALYVRQYPRVTAFWKLNAASSEQQPKSGRQLAASPSRGRRRSTSSPPRAGTFPSSADEPFVVWR